MNHEKGKFGELQVDLQKEKENYYFLVSFTSTCKMPLSVGLLTLGEARCHITKILKKPYGEAHRVRN